ncbi:MAG: UDP-N-acetylmuramate dehydrogenase, partial [Desulfovibrionaceae bacterium]|nr:UDP-N-acetylmuramate dehydrogenase [Desulfovibrionaceae bacterium]
GVPLPRLLRFCMTHGLSGLEGLAGIPGSVGGAVAMNAGSFGVATCEKLESICVITNNEVRNITVEALHYGYRHLSLSDNTSDFIVIEATFSLTEATRNGIRKGMCHNFFEKKSRQPVTAWSAGCVFKNPAPGTSAGKLLDTVGFKGKKLGGMAFSDIHANFLINEGRGSSEAALCLLREAREAVRLHFGIELEPEV